MDPGVIAAIVIGSIAVAAIIVGIWYYRRSRNTYTFGKLDISGTPTKESAEIGKLEIKINELKQKIKIEKDKQQLYPDNITIQYNIDTFLVLIREYENQIEEIVKTMPKREVTTGIGYESTAPQIAPLFGPRGIVTNDSGSTIYWS